MQFGESKAKVFFGKKPEITFEDVAGVDSAKEELNEVVLFLKEPKRFLKLGARIPKGLLMVGPPGTGKTLLAKAIAGEAGVPFFHTSGSEFEEMLVGAGASRVRDLFSKARKASPSLVFVDEIDAVARKRGTTVQSSSTEQTLNQILVEMDGFEKNTNVIVIAATNRPDVIDPAILRPGRFDRRIVIDLPDINGREEILKIHASNKPLAKSVDLAKVARRTVGYSGADLENMLNEAAIIVAKDNRKEITFNDIEESATRVGMGRERKLQRTKDELKKTAYHEAGHAIIAKVTPQSDPVHRITIVSRGMALGVTMQLPERDKYSQSYVEMESRLRVLMGGRAAEEIIYGEENITSGASNDIEKATSIARKMVKQFAYSKKLGIVKYGESNELQYLGYGYGEQRDYSEETAKTIDAEVKRIIEKEIIEGEDFDKYFGSKERNKK
jgi:cell division protease FtsH